VNQTLDNRDLFHLLHVSADYGRLVEGLNSYSRIVAYPIKDLIRRIDEALGELVLHEDDRRAEEEARSTEQIAERQRSRR
jgi:hypothetical protein